MSNYLITDAKELRNYYLEHHNKETAFLTNGGFIVEVLDEGILAEYDLIQNGYYLVASRMEPENNIDIIVREFEQTDVDAKRVMAVIIIGLRRSRDPCTMASVDSQLLPRKRVCTQRCRREIYWPSQDRLRKTSSYWAVMMSHV